MLVRYQRYPTTDRPSLCECRQRHVRSPDKAVKQRVLHLHLHRHEARLYTKVVVAAVARTTFPAEPMDAASHPFGSARLKLKLTLRVGSLLLHNVVVVVVVILLLLVWYCRYDGIAAASPLGEVLLVLPVRNCGGDRIDRKMETLVPTRTVGGGVRVHRLHAFRFRMRGRRVHC